MDTKQTTEPCEMFFSLKGAGRAFKMSWPDDISTVEVDFVLEVTHLQMRTVRREAELREAGVKRKADLEWNSWFPEGHPMRAIVKTAIQE